jgi:hypothetical protein
MLQIEHAVQGPPTGSSGHKVPYLDVVNTWSATQTIAPASGGAVLGLAPVAAAQQAIFIFTQGTAKWQLGKQIDDSFFLYDVASSSYVFQTPSSGTNVTFSRDLTISKSTPILLVSSTAGSASLSLSRVSGQSAIIYGYTGGSVRWGILPGDAGAESTGNVGSHFAIYRYTDAGAFVDAPFTINRTSGLVNVANSLLVGGTISEGGVLLANKYAPIAMLYALGGL